MSTNPYQNLLDSLATRIQESEQLLSDPDLGLLAQAELEELKTELAQLQAAADQFSAHDDNDPLAATEREYVNCTIEVRQGTGGDEAKIWAHDLLRMYLRFSEICGLTVEFLDDLVIKMKGRTRAVPALANENGTVSAYALMKYESGVHRVQRVPATEAQGRIHTSTASVAVLPEVAKNAVTIRDEDLEWQFMRAGGAGGQSVNKTSSAVRLIHVPTGITVSARQERKQSQNREIALELLRAQLWEIEEEKRLAQIGEARSAIGRAQRAEKIRTYNYPQNRVTDHRTKQSWYSLSTIMEGQLVDVMTELHQALESGPINPEDVETESDSDSGN